MKEQLEEAINTEKKEIDKLQSEIKRMKKELKEHEEKVLKFEKRLNKIQGNCYYVYIVFVNGIPRYVGKGTGDRYKHAISGASSVPELNKDFFNTANIEVRILYGNTTFTEDEAFKYEKDVIGSLKDIFKLYNKVTPKNTEYNFIDCDFRDYSDLIAKSN